MSSADDFLSRAKSFGNGAYSHLPREAQYTLQGVSGLGSFVADVATGAFNAASNVVKQGEAIRTNNPKASPYYNSATGTVENPDKRLMVDAGLTAFNIAGGQVIGGAARGLGRATSGRLAKFADIPDPIAKFQGGTSVLPASTKPLNTGASAGQKAKATLAAGLTANPASAGAKAVIQDVGVVPRSVSSRVTREMGGHGTANSSTRGAQFTIPNAARETSLAEFKTTSAARAASKKSAITKATAIPDSAASAVTSRVVVNSAATTVANKAKQLSNSDTVASTRAEDLNQVNNVVKNPFENSKDSGTSNTSNPKVKPTTKEKPTKLKPVLLGGMDFGGQNVKLRRVY